MGFNPYFQYKTSDPMSHFVQEQIPVDLIMSNLKDRQKRQDIERAKLDKISAYNLKTGTENDQKTLQMYRDKVINPFVQELYNSDMSVGNAAQRIAGFVGDLSNDATLKDITTRAKEMETYNKTKTTLLAQGKLNRDYEYMMNKRLQEFEGLNTEDIYSGVEGRGAIGMKAAGAINRRKEYETLFNNLKPKIVEKYGKDTFDGLEQWIRTGTSTISMNTINKIIDENIGVMMSSNAGEQEKWYYDRLVDEGKIDPRQKDFRAHMYETLQGVGSEFLRGDYKEVYDGQLNKAVSVGSQDQSSGVSYDDAIVMKGKELQPDKLWETIYSGTASGSDKQFASIQLQDQLHKYEQSTGQSNAEKVDSALVGFTSEEYLNSRVELLMAKSGQAKLPDGKTREQTTTIMDNVIRRVAQEYANSAAPGSRYSGIDNIAGKTKIDENGISPFGLPKGVVIPLEDVGLTPKDLEGWTNPMDNYIERAVQLVRNGKEGQALRNSIDDYHDGFIKETEGTKAELGRAYTLSLEKERKIVEDLLASQSMPNQYKVVAGTKEGQSFDLASLQNLPATHFTAAVIPNPHVPRLQITTRKGIVTDYETGKSTKIPGGTYILEPTGDWRGNEKLQELFQRTIGKNATASQIRGWEKKDVYVPAHVSQMSTVLEAANDPSAANVSEALVTKNKGGNYVLGYAVPDEKSGNKVSLDTRGWVSNVDLLGGTEPMGKNGNAFSVMAVSEVMKHSGDPGFKSPMYVLQQLALHLSLTKSKADVDTIIEAVAKGETATLTSSVKQDIERIKYQEPFIFKSKANLIMVAEEYSKYISYKRK